MKTIYQLNRCTYQWSEHTKTIAISSDPEKLEEIYFEECVRLYNEVEDGDPYDYDRWDPLDDFGALLTSEEKSEQKPWRSGTNHYVIEEVEYLD